MDKLELDRDTARFLVQLATRLKITLEKPDGNGMVSMIVRPDDDDADELEQQAQRMNVSTGALTGAAIVLVNRQKGIPISTKDVAALQEQGLSIPQLQALTILTQNALS